jgi:hypothetical protein
VLKNSLSRETASNLRIENVYRSRESRLQGNLTQRVFRESPRKRVFQQPLPITLTTDLPPHPNHLIRIPHLRQPPHPPDARESRPDIGRLGLLVTSNDRALLLFHLPQQLAPHRPTHERIAIAFRRDGTGQVAEVIA